MNTQGLPVHINTGLVLPSGLPFSEAVQLGDLLLLSGQIGIVPGQLTLAPGGIRAEARQAMDNIRMVLESQGLTMANIVKCTVMLADMAEWSEFNEIYRTYFTEGRFPARSGFGCSGLAFGARAEIECIAVA